MIENLSFEWLTQSVPLYAFIAALLTKPFTWSDRVNRALDAATSRVLNRGDDGS